MASATIALACTKSRMIYESSPNYSSESSEYYVYVASSTGAYVWVLLKFEDFPVNLRYNRILSANVRLTTKRPNEYINAPILIRKAPESITDFDADITWDTADSAQWKIIGNPSTHANDFTTEDFPIGYPADQSSLDKSKNISAAILRPISLGATNLSTYRVRMTPNPSLIIEYDSEYVPTQVTGAEKTSGYVNPHIDQTFSWRYDWSASAQYVGVGPISQKSYTFYWRTSPTGAWEDSYTALTAEQSITIPAGTFPVGTIYWKVVGIDSVNQISESPVYTLSTEDALTTGTPTAPKSEIVSGDEAITFSWEIANDHGTEQTGADLQYSAGGAWVDFAHISGPTQEYVLAPNTLSAGQFLWRVRVYNVDNVVGPWSDTAAFIVLDKPTISGLYVTSAPFATVSWQSDGQQAYSLWLDGKQVGTFWGAEKSYTFNEFLADGPHSVDLRVQNTLGIWSEPAVYIFTTTNIASSTEIILAGNFAVNAELFWQIEGQAQTFFVYRDGKRIARTTFPFFTDRFVLGAHSYYVLAVMPDGYYSKSNTVSGSMETETVIIDLLYNPRGWQALRLTANDPDEQGFSYQRTASLRHFTGAAYPVVELSKFEDGSGSYNVAFPSSATEEAQQFEELRGQVVVIKSRRGNVVVGPMLQLQKQVGEFYTTYSFTVQRIHWEDFVDDSGG